MSFKSEQYFTKNAIQTARELISLNNGNEILLVGKVNESGQISEVFRAAMGNSNSVAAVINAAMPGEILIHNHPGDDIRPSPADIEIAARAAEKGIGSYIIDNSVSSVFPIVERILPDSDEIELIDPEEIIGILGKDGSLKKAFPSFEFRTPQTHMALEVTESINSSLLLSVEAGTGTGKSFAYLVPALVYVSRNKGKKAVISTSTIALEEQLFDKDIPFLIEKLGFDDINAVLMKGRSNYLCKRKYYLFRMEGLQTGIDDGKEKTSDIIHEIDTWINQVNDGSKTTMNNALSAEIWSDICADEHACEKSRCKYFNTCYFFKMRRKANFASLILVNHHLLMADISMKMETGEETGLLPKYDILIIDEAHNIFKSAVSFLNESVSTFSIIRQLTKLFNTKSSSGLLTKVLDRFTQPEIVSSVEKAINLISGLNPLLTHTVQSEISHLLGNGNEGLYELDDPDKRKPLKEILDDHLNTVSLIISIVFPVIKRLKEINDSTVLRSINEEILSSLIVEISAAAAKLEAYVEFFEEFLKSTDVDSFVFWGEKRRQAQTVFTISPLNIQKLLAEYLYEKTPAVIMTSATLSTGPDSTGFDFFNRESGLDLVKREKRYVHLESCFDYHSQVKSFVCTDLPSPVTDKELFDEESVAVSKELVKASGGGSLVLFTSIGHREKGAKEITDLDFNVICQGKLPTARLVRKFRDDKNAVLLATDTFWEGIDMKGDTLRNLIIVRLPFRFPSHPFIKRYVAKLEETTGIGGFTIYTLPNAVLKFKQGFGRLIRTKTDIGTVTILDRRIIESGYGKTFIKAAPPGVVFTAKPSSQVVQMVENFFKEQKP